MPKTIKQGFPCASLKIVYLMNIRIAGRLQTLFSCFYCHGVHERGKTRVLKNATWFPFDRGAGGRDRELLGHTHYIWGAFQLGASHTLTCLAREMMSMNESTMGVFWEREGTRRLSGSPPASQGRCWRARSAIVQSQRWHGWWFYNSQGGEWKGNLEDESRSQPDGRLPTATRVHLQSVVRAAIL